MSISAKVICHSRSTSGKELVTLECTYPRAYCHTHVLTHGLLNVNAASNRAVSVDKALQEVVENPYIPDYIGRNQKGMVAGKAFDGKELACIQAHIRQASLDAVLSVRQLHQLGCAKEVANRLLEPFQWITSVITASEWDNFFALRLAPDAQPEMQELARKMQSAIKSSTPALRDYHFPYVSYVETHDLKVAMRLSAARCARVSYNNAGMSKDDDMEFAQKLWKSGHKSPFQHAAIADTERTSNLIGWKRAREVIEENQALKATGKSVAKGKETNHGI